MAGPADVTLDASSELPGAAAPRVALIQGSGVELSQEMTRLLRSRLRISALVLASAFGLFLCWRLVSRFVPGLELLERGPLALHALITATLAYAAFPLCRKCTFSSMRLRIQEALIFGVPAVYFFHLQYMMLRECAAANHPMLPRPDIPWIILIFTYAMFIPNTWRRAACVIAIFVVAPVTLTLTLWATDSGCAQIFGSDPQFAIEMSLTMLMTGFSGIVGVGTINSLRREAFVAKQLGQYRLKSPLGHGGMGDVYLAEHQLMKRPCAIKIIRPEKAGNPTILARFEREVRATAKLSHWNNIDIFDYGRAEDGTFYYVMEYLPGMTLSELVAREGPLPPARVVHLLKQVCLALREAHSIGLIHRDIKPANIFAAERGGVYDVAKLLDFGLVKPIQQSASPSLTQDGSLTGSPLFMSPEQAIGEEELDERSDIYSLGVVAYYLLAGRAPFENEQALKVIIGHASQTPPPLVEFADVPPDLVKIVERCMRKKPEDRFQSVEDLYQALQACRMETQWTSQDAAAWWSDNHRSQQSPVDQHLAAEV